LPLRFAVLAKGGILLRPAMTERVAQAIQEKGTSFNSARFPDRLTTRKSDVLCLLAAGFRNRQIVDSVSRSVDSVKNHSSNIRSELGAQDRTRAVLQGMELVYLRHDANSF
jgi:DNA-binding NarL/FixJ family response regulator